MVFCVYWFVTGLAYVLAWLTSQWTGCDVLPAASVLARGEQERCRASSLLSAAFSTLLCLGGAVNACAGFYANAAPLADGLGTLRRRAGAGSLRRVARDVSATAS